MNDPRAPYRTPIQIRGIVTPFGVAWIECIGDEPLAAPPTGGHAVSHLPRLAACSEVISPERVRAASASDLAVISSRWPYRR